MALYATENITGGPYDSTYLVETVNGFPRGDRAIDAAFIATMVDSIISSGIVKNDGSSFEVTPGDALSVNVSPGAAWARGYLGRLESSVSFELEPGGVYKIFIRQDTSEREAQISLVCNDSGLIPVRSESVYDMLIATVTVPEDAEAISADMIEDMRGSILCEYATSRL